MITNKILSQESVTVTIRTNSESSMIFINEEFAGNEKVTKDLFVGKNEIAIYERKRGWDSRVIVDTIDVKLNGMKNFFEYDIEQRILFDTTPQNAKILKNGILIGHTPFLLEYSLNEVEISKIGYETKNNFLVSDYYQPIELNFQGSYEMEEFSESVYFKILIGTAIALGATTAYLKIQADQKFDKYNETKDRKILDDVDRYDLYSGISLGMLQINIGYLIYRFVFD